MKIYINERFDKTNLESYSVDVSKIFYKIGQTLRLWLRTKVKHLTFKNGRSTNCTESLQAYKNSTNPTEICTKNSTKSGRKLNIVWLKTSIRRTEEGQPERMPPERATTTRGARGARAAWVTKTEEGQQYAQ